MIRIERPSEISVPLVFDSPHSGHDYPPDFDYRIDRQILRQARQMAIEAADDVPVARGEQSGCTDQLTLLAMIDRMRGVGECQ